MISPYLKEFARYTADPQFWKLSHVSLLLKNFSRLNGQPAADDDSSLAGAAEWLKKSQDANNDGGFSARYGLRNGWASSYPETTGYIIPTFIELSRLLNNNEFIERAGKAINFLLNIQLNNGGFPERELSRSRDDEPSMFNTGQIMNGLLEWYKYSKDEKVIDSANRAGGWMISVQEQDGSWKKHTYLNQVVTYSSHATCWLADLGKFTGNKNFLNSSEKHFDWVLRQQDQETGWFNYAGFTSADHLENKSVTHTIAYTLWGMLYMSQIFNRPDGLAAVEKAAGRVADLQMKVKLLPGVLDNKWRKRASYSCMTGNAQFALIWFKLYELTKKKLYLDAALKAVDSVKQVQNLRSSNPGIHGGIPGSFPVWGEYIFMAFPNWAAKFFIDSIIAKKSVSGSI